MEKRSVPFLLRMKLMIIIILMWNICLIGHIGEINQEMGREQD